MCVWTLEGVQGVCAQTAAGTQELVAFGARRFGHYPLAISAPHLCVTGCYQITFPHASGNMNIAPKYPLERELLEGCLACLSCSISVLKYVQDSGVCRVCSSAEPRVKNLV